MSPSKPLITIHDLSVTYDETDHAVLNNINLEIGEGELVLVCGPTGCGKSTLAQILNGLIPYTLPATITGEIEVCGKDPRVVTTPGMARDVGLVFQDPEGQLCTLFLEDEIAFGPENLMVPHDELEKRVDHLLDIIALKRFRYESVFELSGGQKQKANIASVLSMQPKVMIFDMPTANLDPIGSMEVFKLIRKLVTDEAATCIVIENRLDELVPLADRIVVMTQEGSIAFDGTPVEVFQHSQIIMDGLGVELPQVVELAARIHERSSSSLGNRIPLTIEDTSQWMGTLLDKGIIEICKDKSSTKDTSAILNENIVEVKDVHFSYGKGPEILKGISFEMQKGEMLAIVGNNGSGKTTLVKQLVGLLKPTKGSIKVCGMDLKTSNLAEVAARASYVFQYPEHQFVAQGQSVFDEIAFNLRTAGYDETYVKERVDLLIDRCQLHGKETVSPYMLSGGEMRTVSVACMLSTKPELLILDEPTYGQDHQRITALMMRLQELRKSGTSVIMISHDMRLVAEYASKVLLLSYGVVEFFGQPEQLFEMPDLLQKADLKEPPICALVRNLRSAGYDFPSGIITTSAFFEAIKAR
ncbi:MAG: energy-coupling factor transporter ATPase [Anaerolineaceae bacterium]